jgi:hypothetical protein
MVYKSDYRFFWDALKGRLALKAAAGPLQRSQPCSRGNFSDTCDWLVV